MLEGNPHTALTALATTVGAAECAMVDTRESLAVLTTEGNETIVNKVPEAQARPVAAVMITERLHLFVSMADL